MAKYGPDDVVVEIDNIGGTLVDLTQYVLSIGGIKKSAVLEDSRTFGDAWGEVLDTGVRMMQPVPVTFFYDDIATVGPNALFGANPDLGTTRTLKVTYGSTKTTSVEMVVTEVERSLDRGALHKMTVLFTPTGQPTEA
jgi:hypothetical protein